MKILHVLFILAITSAWCRAQDISGNWQGILTQSEVKGALSNSYAYWLNIEQEGNSFTGKTRIEISNTEKYGNVLVRGEIRDGTVRFNGYKVKEGNVEQFGVNWCLIIASLRFSQSDASLSGTWRGGESCGKGEIQLFRSAEEFNESRSQVNDYMSMSEFRSAAAVRTNIGRKKVVIENIQFETNKYDLNARAREVLAELAVVLINNEDLYVKILGHTDNVGNTKENLKLSLLRAKEVASFLIQQGVEEKRCTFEGFGESRPIADNSTSEGRAKNRRIEIEVR